MTELRADLCVIGAGSGGLVAAAAAAQMGARVVLIEGAEMGGECLNTGCVPSKALLAAAHLAEVQRKGGLGVAGAEPTVNFPAVMQHVAATIGRIAPHDGQARFEGLGVTVLRAWGEFISPRQVRAGSVTVKARRFVIATGSHPVIPDIPGLADVPYLTNESLFNLPELPRHLLVLGGGPVGLEMAQAFRRLGAAVTLVHRASILPREDADAAGVLRDALQEEGITLHEGRTIVWLRHGPGGIEAVLDDGQAVTGSHLLLAVGRKPALHRLNLPSAGVRCDEDGILVDPAMRTSNRRIYAIGDVTRGPRFTHAAAAQAGVVVRQVLFGIRARFDADAVPRCVYTAPEVAQLGLTEAEARGRFGGSVQVIRQDLAHNDRAEAEAIDRGFLKLVLSGKRPVGVTIVGTGAGELVALWALAFHARLPLSKLAGTILPYPTLSEISKRAAGDYFSAKLFDSAAVKRVVRLIQRLLP